MSANAPPYLPLLAALCETLPKGGGVFNITILHDSWCELLKSPSGPCNCEPDIAPLRSASG